MRVRFSPTPPSCSRAHCPAQPRAGDRGYGPTVGPQPSKLLMRVRFPLSAPTTSRSSSEDRRLQPGARGRDSLSALHAPLASRKRPSSSKRLHPGSSPGWGTASSPSSSGKDTGFSLRKRGFNSRWGRLSPRLGGSEHQATNLVVEVRFLAGRPLVLVRPECRLSLRSSMARFDSTRGRQPFSCHHHPHAPSASSCWRRISRSPARRGETQPWHTRDFSHRHRRRRQQTR